MAGAGIVMLGVIAWASMIVFCLENSKYSDYGGLWAIIGFSIFLAPFILMIIFG